ncbi:MAG: GNAT family N-acetyltransferase [Pseudonocardiaceae bacterium]
MSEQQGDSSAEKDEVIFCRYNAAEARRLRGTVEEVYARSYVDAIASGDPFDSIDVFMHRFDSYAAQSSFDLVIAYRGNEAIGQAWGWPLTEHSRWWEGLLSEPEPGFTHENGRRTFSFSEIMVSQEWAGKGVAHALHDHLLSVRPESRASLLVEPENTRACRAYLHWGWRKIAQLCPDWDNSPTFDVLILALGKA